MKLKFRIILILFVLTGAVSAQEKINYQLCDKDFRPIYMHDNLPANAVYTNKNASAEARASDVIKRLTFDEKLMLTGGWNKFHYPGIPKLGIPPVYFADASQGVHIKDLCVKVEKTTAFPSELALVATWNTQLAYKYAECISEECQAWGVNVLLGPGVNFYRNAEGGRNFEYLGDDPFLGSAITVSYVKGMQSLGTVATLKTLIGTEQEFARHAADVRVEERALNEIYLAPFKAAISDGGVLAVMTGNNYVNGQPGAADKPLSGDVLRKRYGYKGTIMSDWAGSQFWVDKQNLELNSGHSLLMDNNELFAKYLTNEIAAHPEKKAEIEKSLEKMVFYNLYTFFKSGVYDRPYRNPALVQKIESHKKIALQTAEESITLLKNTGNILPLKFEEVKKIAVLGTDTALTVYAGTGSGAVIGYDHVDYLAGLKKIYGDKIIRQTTPNDDEIKSADVVLYFINKSAGEGSDVPYNLPGIEEKVNHYSSLNKNLVVIYSGGNGFPAPWLSKVKGLVFAYLLGQERGNALANILSGKVNPSGKLPFSIEKDFKDSPAFDYNKLSDGKYYWRGGKPDSKQIQNKFGIVPINYNEGIYIGYRWFEKKNIQPQFPFGYGLSYTQFTYGMAKASAAKVDKLKPVDVSFTVKNTGAKAGAEVTQLYIHKVNSEIDRAVKELKGFSKVFLNAGQSVTVKLPVKWQDLAYWSEKQHDWVVEPGAYEIEIGSSSDNIKSKIIINN